MGKKFKYTILASATIIALCGSQNALSVDQSLTINAEVAAAISVSTSVLDFGIISVDTPASGGSMVISTAGSETPSGVVQAGTSSVGHINITGSNNSTVSVTLESSTTLAGPGANTATVDTFTLAINDTGSLNSNTCTLSSTGLCNLNVGATLTIPASAGSGNYTGTNTVSVIYN